MASVEARVRRVSPTPKGWGRRARVGCRLQPPPELVDRGSRSVARCGHLGAALGHCRQPLCEPVYPPPLNRGRQVAHLGTQAAAVKGVAGWEEIQRGHAAARGPGCGGAGSEVSWLGGCELAAAAASVSPPHTHPSLVAAGAVACRSVHTAQPRPTRRHAAPGAPGSLGWPAPWWWPPASRASVRQSPRCTFPTSCEEEGKQAGQWDARLARLARRHAPPSQLAGQSAHE